MGVGTFIAFSLILEILLQQILKNWTPSWFEICYLKKTLFFLKKCVNDFHVNLK